jgi:FkbM family methyltransferase
MTKIKKCKYGTFVYEPNDAVQGRSLDLYGEYLDIETRFLLGFIRQGDTVIDVGAGIGHHTVAMAKAAGKVIAFEPERHSFYMLCANVSLNDLSNVFCEQYVLGNYFGVVQVPELDVSKNIDLGALRFNKTYEGVKTYGVRVTRIDDLNVKPNLIKMNVNGEEYQVLAGAEQTIKECLPYLHVSTTEEDKDKVIKLIKSYGYSTITNSFSLFSIHNYARAPVDLFKDKVVRITGLPQGISLKTSNSKCSLSPGGKGTTSCSYNLRVKHKDFENYLWGKGIDIGGGYDTLKIPKGTVDAWDINQGDATYMDGADTNYDFVYSSHCLEHIENVEKALENWCRILKPGGILFVVVPDYKLYEKCLWPSKFNADHKNTFSIDMTRDGIGRNNHFNVGKDIVPLFKRLNVNVLESRLESDNYNAELPEHIDQTGPNYNATAQIAIICRKKMKNETR